MIATTTTSLRLDEPVYDPAGRTWHFPIYDSETGRTVGRGPSHKDRRVAEIAARQQLARIANGREVTR